jgi:hypothetical protein
VAGFRWVMLLGAALAALSAASAWWMIRGAPAAREPTKAGGPDKT